MSALRIGALAVDLGPRIGLVKLDEFDVAARRDRGPALAADLEAFQDLVFDLHVPGVVVLTGLNHCARRRDSVAAAFISIVSK